VKSGEKIIKKELRGNLKKGQYQDLKKEV